MQEQALILEGQVTTLEEQSAQMQESIGELLADTGRFRDFLVNLRELLLAIEGLPERPVEGSAN
jgi:hypothetical protein